jgi:hypothetical protein
MAITLPLGQAIYHGKGRRRQVGRNNESFEPKTILVETEFYEGVTEADSRCVNQLVVLLANLTSANMTGTSTSTPTMVANTTGDDAPNKVMATATASSKKLEAPIIPAGAAMS